MELHKLNKLIDKYEAGETSLAEEAQLRNYFKSHNVPAHLEEYQDIFNYALIEKKHSSKKKVRIRRSNKYYGLVGVVASLLLMIGIFSFQYYGNNELTTENLGTIEDPVEAYENTKKTLQMVAEVLNSGRKDLEYLKEFNTTKNKFLNN
ncbi:hypothetical protein L1I30_08855 [Gillisia sp. M10.2A]|uniref:Uncharacterized protein n=1 Tax=Gillisia lutea TaxID=2909668 RepID=A0ABS9EFV3_9FLAO|nr:hypothetical protein [Gillisia lutea]MCF4101772.1 hypothetical protein [Gillisia lutea]